MVRGIVTYAYHELLYTPPSTSSFTSCQIRSWMLDQGFLDWIGLGQSQSSSRSRREGRKSRIPSCYENLIPIIAL
ncbi:hypothetical protein QBC33DRAFT_565885 [Phialemonium atrogriseum]|uniref:Uncharacterized protein n=1 Tax=Phialemonium atrogriseum TaxID=1093897 RepID=A0AAJ0FQW6_9PEZI|nr:uncharacterized protein QBC33DRAFT_565885 [Phialemonium atrogriseum]KAK1771734.1 hypothetical protein QBC33DRAFT_565885 [Phialemonium atrogriseum]